jgi:hypothetical protein
VEGKTYDLPDSLAARLVADGRAKEVGEPAPEPPVEAQPEPQQPKRRTKKEHIMKQIITTLIAGFILATAANTFAQTEPTYWSYFTYNATGTNGNFPSLATNINAFTINCRKFDKIWVQVTAQTTNVTADYDTTNKFWIRFIPSGDGTSYSMDAATNHVTNTEFFDLPVPIVLTNMVCVVTNWTVPYASLRGTIINGSSNMLHGFTLKWGGRVPSSR